MKGKYKKMQDHDVSRLENKCRELIKGFENQLTWKWDGRFETALAEFSATNKDAICKIIQYHMGTVWNNVNHKGAPEIVREIIAAFGGLKPGQQLFTSDPGREDLMVCAFWPWGNGRTISIRVGVVCGCLNDEEHEDLTRMFRTWFAL